MELERIYNEDFQSTNKSVYKKCSCNIDAWEEIVVKDDNHYNNETVIYYHCNNCGIDFAVLDFYSNAILYTDNL